MTLLLADEDAMIRFGAALYRVCPATALIELRGPLGAGKTTLVRGFLRAAGIAGAIKSPTYTLVEPYQSGARRFYHFDLYRLEDPDALEMLGFRDYLEAGSVCLIEWPEQAAGRLPQADLEVRIEVVAAGRRIRMNAATQRGSTALNSLESLETL